VTNSENKNSASKRSLWQKFWTDKSPEEKKRIRSFVPLFLYTFAVMYGVIYLSILNTVNRDKVGTTVKSWFGGDKPEVVAARERDKQALKDSFNGLRKRVSGGR
jgi:hypothetical protein